MRRTSTRRRRLISPSTRQRPAPCRLAREVAVAACLRGDGLQIGLMERALELEDWDEPRWALARPSVAVAHIYSWVDRIGESRELLDESERQLIERGDDGSLPYLWYRRAELDCWSGEWERGYERALEADRLAIQTSQQGMRTLTSFAVGLLAAHLGRVDEARAAVDEGARLATAAGHGIGLAFNLSVLGFLELSLGHADRADAIFGPIVERAARSGSTSPARRGGSAMPSRPRSSPAQPIAPRS